jgi:hypothetical protein
MQGVGDFIEGYHGCFTHGTKLPQNMISSLGLPKCKFCGGSSHSTTGDYPYWVWCCKEAEEEYNLKVDDGQISRLRSRGYKVEKIETLQV